MTSVKLYYFLQQSKWQYLMGPKHRRYWQGQNSLLNKFHRWEDEQSLPIFLNREQIKYASIIKHLNQSWYRLSRIVDEFRHLQVYKNVTDLPFRPNASAKIPSVHGKLMKFGHLQVPYFRFQYMQSEKNHPRLRQRGDLTSACVQWSSVHTSAYCYICFILAQTLGNLGVT